jgi:hypothetical protein
MANSEIIGVPLKAEDILRFGKHKGKQVAWVAVNDGQYINWLIKEKIKVFDEDVLSWLKDHPPVRRPYYHSGGMDADWAAEVGCDEGMWVWGN